MEVLIDEARPLDFLEAFDDAGQVRRHWSKIQFARIAEQVNCGTGVTIRDAAGRLCLTAGLYPDDDGETTEAWFAAGEGLRSRFRSCVRLARQALELAASEAGPLTVVAYIHPDSVAGPRIAAWFGFEADGVGDTWRGPLERWTRRFP